MNLSIWNFDIGLVLFYLLLTLGVGIWKGRGIKNLKDFAIGDNKFANTALIATITATWIDGSVPIGLTERVYAFGIVWLFIFFGGIVEICLFQMFAARVFKFQGCLSVAEILGVWYGKPARVIGGVCVALHSIGMIGAQIAAMGYVFLEFFNIDPSIGIVVAAGVVVIYSAFGGIKSVTITDMIQLAFFMAAMPVIASIIIEPAGGYRGLYDNLPRDHLHITNSYGTLKEYFWLFAFFCIPFFDSCLIQRMLMAKNKDQIKECFLVTAFITVVFLVLCTVTALSMRVIDPNLDPNNVLYTVINNYLPLGIKGLGVAGLLAVVMSTADSYLNVSSVVVINDIINPLRKRILSDSAQLNIARLATIIIGMATIIVAINFDNVLQIMLTAWVIWAPIMVGPLYAAFFGVRANLNTFLIGMASGLTILVIWLVFGIEAKIDVDSKIPSLIANLTAFTLAALYYRKFAPEKLNNPVLPNPEAGELLPPKLNPKAWLKALPGRILAIVPLPHNILKFSVSRVHYFGAQYQAFGHFALASFIMPYFMWSAPAGATLFGYDVAVMFRFIGAALAFIMVSYDVWPEKCKKYLPLYWHLTLMYSLPFITSFLFLYNKGSGNWLINVSLSLMVLAALTDWLSFVILLVIGAGSGTLMYHYLIDDKALGAIFNDFDNSFAFIYVVLFSTIIGMLFSRNREIIQQKVTEQLEEAVAARTVALQSAVEELQKGKDELQKANEETKKALAIKTEILDNISHETRTPIQGVLGMSSALVEDWPRFTEERRFAAVQTIYDSAKRLMSFVHNLVDLSKYKVGKMEFEFEPAHFRPLVDEVIKEAHLFYMPGRNIDLKLNVTDNLRDYISLDEYKVTQMLRNVVGNAFKYMEEGAITISLSNQDNQLLFCVEDQGVGIPDNELEEIFQPFIQSSRTKTGAGGTGVGLTIARDVAIGHGGKIWAENRTPKGARFCLLLPLLPEQPRLEEGASSSNYPTAVPGVIPAKAGIQDNISNWIPESSPRMTMEREGESSNKPRVMIIDDEAVCHGALDMLLTEHCSEIICFTSAIKALAHLRSNPNAADLILLDVMMPGMTGLEFLEIIRQDPSLKHIKVMMQSGNFDQEVMQKTSQLGVSGYIPKPYDKMKVVEMVAKVGK